MKEIFNKWLKLNNCYEQYIFNFDKHPCTHNCNSLDKYLNEYKYTSYVCAFHWNSTNEGYFYWFNLNLKWYFFCKKRVKFICKLEKIT
jgi:hypothetical protein